MLEASREILVLLETSFGLPKFGREKQSRNFRAVLFFYYSSSLHLDRFGGDLLGFRFMGPFTRAY